MFENDCDLDVAPRVGGTSPDENEPERESERASGGRSLSNLIAATQVWAAPGSASWKRCCTVAPVLSTHVSEKSVSLYSSIEISLRVESIGTMSNTLADSSCS